jgi:hypothetical protein
VLILLMLLIFGFTFIFEVKNPKICFIPIAVIDSNILTVFFQSRFSNNAHQVTDFVQSIPILNLFLHLGYRFIVSAFFHSNVLHLTMNILSFRVEIKLLKPENEDEFRLFFCKSQIEYCSFRYWDLLGNALSVVSLSYGKFWHLIFWEI